MKETVGFKDSENGDEKEKIMWKTEKGKVVKENGNQQRSDKKGRKGI